MYISNGTWPVGLIHTIRGILQLLCIVLGYNPIRELATLQYK